MHYVKLQQNTQRLPVQVSERGQNYFDATEMPPPKWGHSTPNIGSCIVIKQLDGPKMPLGTDVGLGSRDIVLDGDPAPPKKGHSTPYFSADVYCGQMAGWIKVPLGVEVGHNPSHIVLGGAELSAGKEHSSPPLFSSCCPVRSPGP